jgi:tRNA G18 (ribose-2'-O)-methylase SpoU
MTCPKSVVINKKRSRNLNCNTSKVAMRDNEVVPSMQTENNA